jgi:hypothetical protein
MGWRRRSGSDRNPLATRTAKIQPMEEVQRLINRAYQLCYHGCCSPMAVAMRPQPAEAVLKKTIVIIIAIAN